MHLKFIISNKRSILNESTLSWVHLRMLSFRAWTQLHLLDMFILLEHNDLNMALGSFAASPADAAAESINPNEKLLLSWDWDLSQRQKPALLSVWGEKRKPLPVRSRSSAAEELHRHRRMRRQEGHEQFEWEWRGFNPQQIAGKQGGRRGDSDTGSRRPLLAEAGSTFCVAIIRSCRSEMMSHTARC